MKDWNLEHQAKIVGECARCGHLYDICRNGFVCNACGNTGNPRGARFEDTNAVYGAIAGNELRRRLDDWAVDEKMRIKSEKNKVLRRRLDEWAKEPKRSDVQYQHYVTKHNWTLTDGEQKDVAELYRMLALEDPRTDQGGLPC
jgi:hypothetical protein